MDIPFFNAAQFLHLVPTTAIFLINTCKTTKAGIWKIYHGNCMYLVNFAKLSLQQNQVCAYSIKHCRYGPPHRPVLEILTLGGNSRRIIEASFTPAKWNAERLMYGPPQQTKTRKDLFHILLSHGLLILTCQKINMVTYQQDYYKVRRKLKQILNSDYATF
jgi:hypothetical protein